MRACLYCGHVEGAKPREFDLRNGLVLKPFRLEFTHAEVLRSMYRDGLELRVAASVLERNTAEPTQIARVEAIPGLVLNGARTGEKEHWRQWVRSILRNSLTHELDELLLLDGQRNDPHAKDER